MRSISQAQMKEAVCLLEKGGVVAFPTETSYGLAVDATNARAVGKVAKLKGRPLEKTFSLIVASTAMADRYGHLRCLGHRLAKKYWPGALTLVVDARKGSGLAKGVIAKDGTIALRVSSHPVAHELSRGLRKPIVATSANVFGEPAVNQLSALSFQVDGRLDAGELPPCPASTIARIADGEVQVLRQGAVHPRDPKQT